MTCNDVTVGGSSSGGSGGGAAAPVLVGVLESLAGRVVGECRLVKLTSLPPRPYGVVTSQTGHVVVSDAANDCLYVFDAGAEYRLLRRIGRRGSRNKQFKSPRHIAITSSNDVLVSDYGNHCLKA